jgi:hypothetical protein
LRRIIPLRHEEDDGGQVLAVFLRMAGGSRQPGIRMQGKLVRVSRSESFPIPAQYGYADIPS